MLFPENVTLRILLCLICLYSAFEFTNCSYIRILLMQRLKDCSEAAYYALKRNMFYCEFD